MDKFKVFVSSTCFDLSQVRRDIEEFLVHSEYEAVLSDSPRNFAVDPFSRTLENCLQSVRESSALLLVVGGRYGAVQEENERSITNMEYDQAMESCVPVLTFVDAIVWAAKREYDLSRDKSAFKHSKVDDNRVFEFIDQLTHAPYGDWVFPFATAQEIVTTTKIQFSYLFAKSLKEQRRRHYLKLLSRWGAAKLGNGLTDLTSSSVVFAREDASASSHGRIMRDLEDIGKVCETLGINWLDSATMATAFRGQILGHQDNPALAAANFTARLEKQVKKELSTKFGPEAKAYFELGHSIGSTGVAICSALRDWNGYGPGPVGVSLADLAKALDYIGKELDASTLSREEKEQASSAIEAMKNALQSGDLKKIHTVLGTYEPRIKELRRHLHETYDRMSRAMPLLTSG